MKLKEELKKGEPTGRIYITINESLYKKSSKGRSKNFTVYDTSFEEVQQKIKETFEK